MRTRPRSFVLLSFGLTLAAACADQTPLEPRATPSATVSAIPSAPMAARAPAVTVTSRFSVPFSFSIPGGTCGLRTTVSATGEADWVVEVTRSGAGEFTGSYISTARGRVAGEDGTPYRYRSVNRGVLRDLTGTIPPGALFPRIEFTVVMVDRFTLKGRGRAPDVHVFQRIVQRINSDGTITVLNYRVVGDPSCSPR